MRIIKGIIFYPLLFCRGVFIRISGLLGGALFLFAILSYFFLERKIDSLYMIIASFAVFMIGEVYDHILLKLNPTNSELYLGK